MRYAYGNAYERCDYLHGGMGAETGWDAHGCVRGACGMMRGGARDA